MTSEVPPLVWHPERQVQKVFTEDTVTNMPNVAENQELRTHIGFSDREDTGDFGKAQAGEQHR